MTAARLMGPSAGQLSEHRCAESQSWPRRDARRGECDGLLHARGAGPLHHRQPGHDHDGLGWPSWQTPKGGGKQGGDHPRHREIGMVRMDARSRLGPRGAQALDEAPQAAARVPPDSTDSYAGPAEAWRTPRPSGPLSDEPGARSRGCAERNRS